MELKYDLFDVLAAAIMIEEPILIVEGKDDFQIYDSLAKSINKKVQIYQSNEFKDHHEGCNGVIKCIEKLQVKYDEREDNVNKIIGIIDKDVRDFRQDIPSLKGLFVTKHYSIETYFATLNNLRQLLSNITYNIHEEIDDDILHFLEDPFKESLENLYIISLEALKNACHNGYETTVGYDFSEHKITASQFLEDVLPRLENKKVDLESFASELNLNLNNVKLIAKGKWYLYWYLNNIYPLIKDLKEKCNGSIITQCRSCRVGNFQDCLYKTKNDYRIDHLIEMMLTFIDNQECEDIFGIINNLN